MSDRLTWTPLQLADELQLPGRDARARERAVLEYRLKYGWPSLKVGKTIRFTREHVEEILRRHSTTAAQPTGAPAAAAPPAVALPGQTGRSAGRSR